MTKICKFCKEEMFEDDKICDECGYDYSNRKKTKKYRNVLLIENDKKRKKIEEYIQDIHKYSCKAKEIIEIIKFFSSDKQTKSDFDYYCKKLELCYYYFTGINLNFTILNTDKIFNNSIDIQNNMYEPLFKIEDNVIESLGAIRQKELFENYDKQSQNLIEASFELIKSFMEGICKYMLAYTVSYFIFNTGWQKNLKNIYIADQKMDECISKFSEIIYHITYYINEF